MKAVVIKINKSKAVVLMSDGTFHDVSNKGYVVGQEIYIAHAYKAPNISRLAKYAAAAAAALVVLVGGFSYAYAVPQSYISMDINPSIEFEVNILGRVINPEGANQDGIQLLNKVSIKNKNVLEAIHTIVSQSGLDGYITQDDSKTVVLGVHSSSAKRQQKMLEDAQMQVENSLKSLQLSAQIAVNPVTEQTIEDAHDAGTTGGKLEIIEEYLEAYPEGLSFDELMAMSVSDILHMLNGEQYWYEEYENEDNHFEEDDDSYEDDDDNSEDSDTEDEEHSEYEIDDEHQEHSDDDSEQEHSYEPNDEEESDDEPDDDESDDEEYHQSSEHEEEEDS